MTEKDPREELMDAMENCRNEITAAREKFEVDMAEIHESHRRRMRTLNRAAAGVAVVGVLAFIAVLLGSLP